MANKIKIVENGITLERELHKLDEFLKTNTVKHLFGESAKRQGESPLKMQVDFTDGNSVGFRGDRFTGYVAIMASNLLKQLINYSKNKVLRSAIIYDNRDFKYSKIVFHYEEGKVKKNYLPLYIPTYKIPTK